MTPAAPHSHRVLYTDEALHLVTRDLPCADPDNCRNLDTVLPEPAGPGSTAVRPPSAPKADDTASFVTTPGRPCPTCPCCAASVCPTSCSHHCPCRYRPEDL